ncbi:MAG: bifunctional DNA primase/polymerase [Treponema sp.]|nr:bifunctional DNA primase/polymerase [Treponema sp.]
MNPANIVHQCAGPVADTTNIIQAPENGKPFDLEALTERAAILEFDAGFSRYHAERRAAELYGLTTEQREAVFPLPRRTGFEAVLFMTGRGFSFIPWNAREGRPAVKWTGEHRKNFTPDPERLRAWSGAGFKRFMYLPGLCGYIGLDIDVGHADGKDGLQGFYRVMETLAGKPAERLPSYLRDLPRNFPCYTRTPRGGLHLLFRYCGPCKAANLTAGECNIEIKYQNSGLSLGEKAEVAYTLCGDPIDAPDLPLFLAELINPQPKPAPQPERFRRNSGKPDLQKIADKVIETGSGHNDYQKKFAWRMAYFGYSLEETLEFVKSRPDVFGSDQDTETVVRHAWQANTARATA